MRRVVKGGGLSLTAGIILLLLTPAACPAQNPNPQPPSQPKPQPPTPASYKNQQHEQRINQQINQQVNQLRDQSASPEETQPATTHFKASGSPGATLPSSQASTATQPLVPAPKPLPAGSTQTKGHQKSAPQSTSGPGGGS